MASSSSSSSNHHRAISTPGVPTTSTATMSSDSSSGGGGHGGTPDQTQELSPLEQEVLDEYAALARNLGVVSPSSFLVCFSLPRSEA